jgi:hypothetical protein
MDGIRVGLISENGIGSQWFSPTRFSHWASGSGGITINGVTFGQLLSLFLSSEQLDGPLRDFSLSGLCVRLVSEG